MPRILAPKPLAMLWCSIRRVTAGLVGAALLAACATPPESAELALEEAPAAEPWAACVGEDPCAANVFCDAARLLEDARCLGKPEGACLRYSADEGLSCFPTAAMTVGRCDGVAACVEAP